MEARTLALLRHSAGAALPWRPGVIRHESIELGLEACQTARVRFELGLEARPTARGPLELGVNARETARVRVELGVGSLHAGIELVLEALHAGVEARESLEHLLAEAVKG